MNPLPAAVRSAFDLIVDADPRRNLVLRKIQEGHFQTAPQVTYPRIRLQVGVCRPEPHFCDEVIQLRVSHLFAGGPRSIFLFGGKIVVADVCSAADA